jgi:hypothetical protein
MPENPQPDAKQAVIDCLNELRDALSREPISDTVTKARHQCDRLEHGLALAHPEGIRFAAHTLLRLIDPAHAKTSDAVAEVRARLADLLVAGGFRR